LSVSPKEVALDLRFEAGELYSVRSSVAAHAADLGAPSAVIQRLLIVASELATNAIRHGGGRGRLRLWADSRYLHCEVTDGGVGLPDLTAGMSRPDPSAPGGRGLWISRQLGDVFALDSGAKGTTVHVAIEYGEDGAKPV
jgi:anti-sigma regulatory factor (Ser/Thr protein kinase)